MVKSISRITLYVNNPDEAKSFWTEKMGFILRFEQPMGPGMKWIEVGPDAPTDTVFVLYDKKLMSEQNPGTDVGHPSVILSSGDIVKTYEEIRNNGVKTEELMELPYGRMFQFYDMDGNVFLIRED